MSGPALRTVGDILDDHTAEAAGKARAVPAVYRVIAAVQGELARDGIAKDRRNGQQGYNFRGIDDVYNALAPLLAKHGLCILPRCLNREQVERTSAKGGALFYTTVDVEFDFIAAEDGSRHTVRAPGEAMDSADKSTNKAMSAAYKYAAMQAFCIPTEGDNDADATTHEVAPRQQPERREARAATISADQCAELRKLIGQSGRSEEAFCEYLKVGTLPELHAGRFDYARNALTDAIERRKPKPAQASDIIDDDIPY